MVYSKLSILLLNKNNCHIDSKIYEVSGDDLSKLCFSWFLLWIQLLKSDCANIELHLFFCLYHVNQLVVACPELPEFTGVFLKEARYTLKPGFLSLGKVRPEYGTQILLQDPKSMEAVTWARVGIACGSSGFPYPSITSVGRGRARAFFLRLGLGPGPPEAFLPACLCTR